MKLHRDLNEFLRLLNAADVRYLIVGGYAVAAHGHVRYTRDLDVWLDASRANAARVVAVLSDFGFKSLAINESDLQEPGQVVQIGYDPARIDLMTSVSGLEFDSAFERRIETELDDIPIGIPCREDLMKNKLATGRLRDLADLQDLGFDLPTTKN